MVVSILYGLIIILGTLTNLTMLFAFFTNKVLTVRSPKKITYENKEHNHAICVQCNVGSVDHPQCPDCQPGRD